MKVYITKGLPACGKTTWATKLMETNPGKIKRICKDDLRRMLDNGEYSHENEKYILQARNSLVITAITSGFDVIVDDTNLHPKHIEEIKKIVAPTRAEVIVQDFTYIGPAECIKRDKKRPNYVGEDVILKQYYSFLYTPPAPIPFNPDLPECLVVDVDGTLALLGDRSPYDTKKCDQDVLNVAVAEVIDMYRRRIAPAFILLITGRNEEHRKATHQWLAKYHVPFDALYMRQDGDKRSDFIIKEEIYEQEIKGKYNVLLILEDRTQVVKMWREKGLPCWQVALGDY